MSSPNAVRFTSKVFGSLAVALLTSMLAACEGGAPEAPSLDARAIGEGHELIGGQATTAQDPGRNSVVMVLGPQKKGTAPGQADFSTCTGVLIAKNVILTAAHCLKPAAEDAALYHDGVYEDLGLVTFAADPTQARRLRRILVHPEYKGQEWIQVKGGFLPRTPRDLAIARFEGEAPAAAEIARIPQIEVAKIAAQTFYIYGYGLYSLADSVRAERDQNISWGREYFAQRTPLLGIQREARFDSTFEYGFLIDQRGKAGICFGDSGGPAFIRYRDETFLVAIHSHRTGTYKGLQGDSPTDPRAVNDCQYFAVMTRTGGFYDWINKSVAQINESTCENQPLFRERLAALFAVELPSLKVRHLAPSSPDAAASGGASYEVQGRLRGLDRPVKYRIESDTACRVPARQGYLHRAPPGTPMASRPLQTILEMIANEHIDRLEVHSLRDRLPFAVQLDGQSLILNLTGLFGWHPPEDGWIFQSVRATADGELFAVPEGVRDSQIRDFGNSVMAALEIESPRLRGALAAAVKAKLRVFWLAYSLPGQNGFNQELWVRDPAQSELLILRQSVRL